MKDYGEVYCVNGVGRRLAQRYDVTKNFVSLALHCKRNSDLATEIRRAAVEDYGCPLIMRRDEESSIHKQTIRAGTGGGG